MAQKRHNTAQTRALERAAKYICTSKCGLCPMVVEHFSCPHRCTLRTKPWQCWLAYFTTLAKPDSAVTPQGI